MCKVPLSHPSVPDRMAPALECLSPDIVAKLQAGLPCQSKEVIMDRLGISSNTWTKLKRGVPVRRSIVERLVAKVTNY
jgi:hypothetical protein